MNVTADNPKLKLIICRGPSCSLAGSAALVDWCRDLEAAGLGIASDVSRCTGNCEESPVVQWNGTYLTRCSPEKLTERLIEEDLL